MLFAGDFSYIFCFRFCDDMCASASGNWVNFQLFPHTRYILLLYTRYLFCSILFICLMLSFFFNSYIYEKSWETLYMYTYFFNVFGTLRAKLRIPRVWCITIDWCSSLEGTASRLAPQFEEAYSTVDPLESELLRLINMMFSSLPGTPILFTVTHHPSIEPLEDGLPRRVRCNGHLSRARLSPWLLTSRVS